MARPSNTKSRIQEVARELFQQKGVQKTSLQEIANRLGITKPALYYHFSSREELVRSIVQPLIDDGDAFLSRQEALETVEPRALLEGFFDYQRRHMDDWILVMAELSTLNELGLVQTVMTWRERLVHLLFGPEPTLAEATRAVLALGGLQDCAVYFSGDVPADELRRFAVDAACAALGIPAEPAG